MTPTYTESFNIEPLEPFGAVVTGIGAVGDMPAEVLATVVKAFGRHGLLVFRGLALDDDQQTAFSRQFGDLIEHPKGMRMYQSALQSSPTILNLTNVDENGEIMSADAELIRAVYRGNTLWHTDGSTRTVPPMASILSARILPPWGGNTEFADMRAAWDALPDAMQKELLSLITEHSIAHSRKAVGYVYDADESGAQKATPQALVRIHSPSGRKALYFGSYASHIIGWPMEQGRALLDELMDFATQDRFVYRHAWRNGDIVMWDNRCMMHRVRPWDVEHQPRVMRRTTLAGWEQTLKDGRSAVVGS